MNFDELKDKHRQLIYEDFKILSENGNLKITFNFLLTPNIKFMPELTVPNVSEGRLKEIGSGVLQNLVFNLGMIELLSYWKAACSPQIIIKAGFLDQDQIAFWKKLLVKGLGEFFYNNKIDFTQKDLVEFKIENRQKLSLYYGELKDRDLVLVGGGKDSALTLESDSQKGKEFQCLVLNPTEAAIKIAKVGGCKNSIIIKRIIDPALIKLNEQGYLNGHTPFSAYLAFLSTLAGVLYDYKNLVVSNEASSNEGNVKWMGQEINHQYSKTGEFEQDFRDYSKKYLSPSVNYFSFLSSLGELQVAESFSKMEKYHKLFRSCNKGSKQGIWCGKCPKCVSTYLLLYPFLGKKVAEIFGKNLLDDENLIPIVHGLLRENDQVKPFECVATVEEIKLAISLSVERAKKNGEEIPKVLQSFQTILILGLGREGLSVLKFLKEKFPFKKVDAADRKEYLKLPKNVGKTFFGENYLSSLTSYDVIIKSPGIPFFADIQRAKEEGKIITSPTAIFLKNCKGKVIGVTGTKGKSTTASLIYEVFKKGGFEAHLIGNIGAPALDFLKEDSKDSIFVYELSSFQLEDLDVSPYIAVMTNIYPEHLDHHGNFSTYVKAKNNITKFQTQKDYLIYNKDIPGLKLIAQVSKAKKISFSKEDKQIVENLVHKDTIPLLGEFNLLNIMPAIIIGRLFKIPDEKIEEAIINFKPLPHRLEFVGEVSRIRFYNDSLSTIPEATVEALSALGRNVATLIAGGFDRGLDYSILGEAIAKSHIKTLILFPDTGIKIWDATSKYSKKPPQKFDVEYMGKAVKIAFEVTEPGKICLLSPASTSFNLFRDFEDRGNQFKDWVRKLGAD